MPKPELTKQLIAQTLKELMKTTPLDKIGVQDIVDACGLNRKTFYYHFLDKQALICWIFDEEFSAIWDVIEDSAAIDHLLEHLYNHRDFYIAALTSEAQNNLSEHLFKISYDFIISKILTLLGTHSMPPNDMRLRANLFSNAVVGSVTQWAREGMKVSPKELNESFYPLILECLDFVVNKYISEQDSK